MCFIFDCCPINKSINCTASCIRYLLLKFTQSFAVLSSTKKISIRKSKMPRTFSVEHAKSGRAGCKACNSKIAKGSLRMGVHSEGNEDAGIHSMVKWYHLSYVNIHYGSII